jgi:hypothetical protein
VSSGDTFHPRELLPIAASKDNLDRLAAVLSDVDARILGPDGQRSRSVPSAAMLASVECRSDR